MSPSRCYSLPFVSTPPCPQVRAGATEEEQRGTLLGLGAIGANHGGGVSLSALPTVFCCIAVVFLYSVFVVAAIEWQCKHSEGHLLLSDTVRRLNDTIQITHLDSGLGNAGTSREMLWGRQTSDIWESGVSRGFLCGWSSQCRRP